MVDHPEDPAPDKTPRQAYAPEAAGAAEGGERIAKALARAGVASRREVERYIAEGRVALNGKVLDSPGVKVGANDILTVDGQAVDAAEPTRVFRYHKPVGLLTTNSDPAGRPTVFASLPPGLPRLIAVGRLDINTEGLLLLTNDGELARALELPSRAWVRRYRARCYGRTDQAKLDMLKAGVTVEGVAYGPIEARLDKAAGAEGANLWISVAITEGKNREVRRVLEHLGLKVNRLIRLAYGPFALSTLEPGAVEEVGPRVIREQLAEVVSPQSMPAGERALFVPKRPAAAKAARREPTAGGPAGATRRMAEAGRPEKPVYKPGWARPAKRERPAGAGAGAGAGAPKAKSYAATLGDDRPGLRPRPSPRPDPRPGPRDGLGDARPEPRDRREGAADKPFRREGRPDAARARSEDRPFKPRPAPENAGRSPRGPERAESPSKPFRPKPSGAKFGPRPPKPGGAKAPAVAATPKRTGMELTPPMRRGPRRKGPARPPQDD